MNNNTLIFDLESDGLLDQTTEIHCICIKDVECEIVYRCLVGSTLIGIPRAKS